MDKTPDYIALIVGHTFRYAYYSHHKCATSWTNSILRELCFHLGLNHKTAHGPQQYSTEGELRRWVEVHDVEFLTYTNAEISEARKLPPHRGFHVIRDPRDVLVSGYFSHKNSHPTDGWPELREHRAALNELPKEDGLLREIDFSRRFLLAMKEWDYEQEHVLEIKMETLTAEPRKQLRRILEHLDLWDPRASSLERACQKVNRWLYALHHRAPNGLAPAYVRKEAAIHSGILDSVLDAHAFDRLTDGRSKGEENPDSHYRKGKPGDWENHFTKPVAEVFRHEYGDIVERLGYEWA